MGKRLYRSDSEKMIAGVCGGLAEYFEIDPTVMRVLFVVAALLNGFGILLYLVLAIIVPRKPTEPPTTPSTESEGSGTGAGGAGADGSEER